MIRVPFASTLSELPEQWRKDYLSLEARPKQVMLARVNAEVFVYTPWPGCASDQYFGTLEELIPVILKETPPPQWLSFMPDKKPVFQPASKIAEEEARELLRGLL